MQPPCPRQAPPEKADAEGADAAAGADGPDWQEEYGATREFSRGGEVDPLGLAWFEKQPDLQEEPLTLTRVVAAVNPARLTAAEGQLVSWMTENREPLAMRRLTPLGAPEDTVEAMAWVPASWGKAGITAEGLRGHGAPQLLCGQLGSARFAPMAWPFYGQACYMHVMSGQVCVLSWPVQAITRTGTPIRDTDTLLASMTAAPWDAFCEEHVDHVILQAGQSIWVPNGQLAALVTLGDRTQPRTAVTSTVLYVPVMSGVLLGRCPVKTPVITYAAYNARLQLRTGTASWRSWAADFLEWLTKVDPEAAAEGDGSAGQVEGAAIQPAR
jgi:hypothetical protein